jgi:hypothetical protein
MRIDGARFLNADLIAGRRTRCRGLDSKELLTRRRRRDCDGGHHTGSFLRYNGASQKEQCRDDGDGCKHVDGVELKLC